MKFFCFHRSFHSCSGPPTSHFIGHIDLFPRGWSGWTVKLTIHLHPVLKNRNHGAITPHSLTLLRTQQGQFCPYFVISFSFDSFYAFLYLPILNSDIIHLRTNFQFFLTLLVPVYLSPLCSFAFISTLAQLGVIAFAHKHLYQFRYSRSRSLHWSSLKHQINPNRKVWYL